MDAPQPDHRAAAAELLTRERELCKRGSGELCLQRARPRAAGLSILLLLGLILFLVFDKAYFIK